MANKRNILVCGGGGFIAGHLAKDLQKQGHNVRVVDKKPLIPKPWMYQIMNIFIVKSIEWPFMFTWFFSLFSMCSFGHSIIERNKFC